MTILKNDIPVLGTDTSPAPLPGAAAGEGAGTASLEKVRDILFGQHMREVDRRFARLEDRIAKETRELKDDLKKRLDALEAYANRETESLGDRLRHEQADRAEAVSKVSRDLTEAARDLERRTASLDEQMAKGHREIRQQMLDQHQRLSDDIRQKV